MRTSGLTALLLLGIGSTGDAQSVAGGSADKPLVDALGDPLPPGAFLRLGTVRWRPSGSIQHLAFAPDGKRLASWHDEHYTTAAMTIWDVDTGRELRRVEMPGLGIASWQWLADGRGISVVQTSEGRFIWEFSDDKFVPRHRPDTGGRFGVKVAVGGPVVDNENLAGFAVSPDGKILAAGKSGAQPNKEREIVVWDLATQRKLSDLPKPRRLGAAPNSCYDLFFTPDGSKLVVFCQPMEKKDLKEYLVAVVDAATGKELRRFNTAAPLQQGSRMSLALSARYLALGLEDEQGSVLLWDLEHGQDTRLTSGHGKKNAFSGYGVSALAFTEDSMTLVTAGRDGNVKTWDIGTAKERRVIANAYPGWIETLAVTRDGKRLACAGQDGIIRHWDLTNGNALDVQPGHRERITGVSVTPAGTVAVTSSSDRHLRIWDLHTGRERRTISLPAAHYYWPHAIMAPDGRTVVVSVADKLMAWNVDNGQEYRLPEQPADLKVGHLAFGGSGKTLLAGHKSIVTLLDWPSGRIRRRFTLPEPLQKPGEAHCDAVTLSPDGRWLASLAHRSWHRQERGMRFGAGADGVLDLWNALTGERVHRLLDGGVVGRTAVFTADGDLLVDGGGKLHPRRSICAKSVLWKSWNSSITRGAEPYWRSWPKELPMPA